MLVKSLQSLPNEVLEYIISFLDPRSIDRISKVDDNVAAACVSVCRSKCCEHVPQDIFLEIWEELGFPSCPDYTRIWLVWAEGQLGGGVAALTDHSLQVDKLRAAFPGPWTAHTHQHQLIVSTFRVSGSRLVIGQADGTLQLYDVLEPSFVKSVNIEDGSVREVELWHSENLVAVAGDTLLHMMELDTLGKISIPDIELCEENKHISCFGAIISYCDMKSDIIVCSFVKPRERYGDNPFNRLFAITTKNASPIQWKIWGNEVIVLDTQGTVLVYNFHENITELAFQSESNVMLLYKNPCHMFRDVILCSSSAAAGLIVRASYWLLGWRLQDTGGKLHRALEQDKVSPQEEVWALAIRRNLVLCGTEGGVLMLFTNDETDDQSRNYQVQALKDIPLKRGHSKVELKFSTDKSPVFERRVSHRPILAVDIGISGDKILLFYRNNIQTMSCLVLNTANNGFSTSSSK